MRYGLFSDVHSNLEAFKVVLDVLKEENVDKYIFVGDLVGYGANPKECIELLKRLAEDTGCVCVAGNHDYATCGKTSDIGYNHYAVDAIHWTKKQLNDEDIAFLSDMKLVEKEEDLTIVHANLIAPADWGYIIDIDDAFPNFSLMEKQICFIGHSHRPIIFTAGETIDWSVSERLEISQDMKYIINIGSVGQPRDGDPRASCAVYDTDTNLVEIKRSDYNIRAAQKKIMDANLPQILAERLSLGR